MSASLPVCDAWQCWQDASAASAAGVAFETPPPEDEPSWLEVIVGGAVSVVDRGWDGVEAVVGIVSDVPKAVSDDVTEAADRGAEAAEVIADRSADAAEVIARQGGNTAFWGGLGVSTGAIGGAALVGVGVSLAALALDGWFTGGRLIVRPILTRLGA